MVLSRALVFLALVAACASGCGDSAPVEEAGPDSAGGHDVNIEDADAAEDDASKADGPSDDDASRDAGALDQSSEDGSSGEASLEASTTSDVGADQRSADAAPDGVGADAAMDSRAGDVAIDGDGGCACTVADSGAFGNVPLACFCGNGGCLSYEVAITQCPFTPFPEDHRLDVYADCNLVVIFIGNSIGIGGSSYVYDAATHELVGASAAGDYPGADCGTTKVFGYQAGTFPPPTCPRTQSMPRCADGGDGG